MSVTFAGVRFKNPIVAASGAFGFGREYGRFYSLAELGGICVKGLTARARAGNPPPRVAETPMGMLNSVGLQNPGVDAFIADELPGLREYDTAVVANISGNTAVEYGEMAEKLSDARVDIIEVNVSCPNVKRGGMMFGASPGGVAEVTREVRGRCAAPIMVKLSPNAADVAELARAAEAEGADAISLINTLIGMRIDVRTRRPVLRMNTGGLSGPAVLPVAVRMVWQVSGAVSIPVLGVGGVSRWQDAAEMMLAGAALVGVGTACFGDPFAPLAIRDGLEKYVNECGCGRVGELTNGVILN
jgi:dihydroorotate dehydrogenase (NAD+) catalytic subunit